MREVVEISKSRGDAARGWRARPAPLPV